MSDSQIIDPSDVQQAASRKTTLLWDSEKPKESMAKVINTLIDDGWELLAINGKDTLWSFEDNSYHLMFMATRLGDGFICFKSDEGKLDDYVEPVRAFDPVVRVSDLGVNQRSGPSI